MNVKIDARFVERVRECLGDEGIAELTPSGRTLVRYAGRYVVTSEGLMRQPIAGRIVNGELRFAVVRKGQPLKWVSDRPGADGTLRPSGRKARAARLKAA